MRRRGQRGFTLVELLVVIAIIVVLAGIVYASTGEVREKARQSVCTSQLRQIGQAIAMYRQDYDGTDTPGWPAEMGLPPSLLTLAETLRSSGTRYLTGGDAILHCPNVTSENLRQYRMDPAGPWTLYNYQGYARPTDVNPPQIPAFPSIVERRGTEFPIAFDRWHDRPPLDRAPQSKFVLVLRLDGRVSARHVPRGGGSWEW